MTSPNDGLTGDAGYKALDPWLDPSNRQTDFGVFVGCSVVLFTWLLLSTYSVRKRAKKHREALLQRLEVYDAGAIDSDEVQEFIREQEHVTELLDFHSEVRQYLEYSHMLDEVRWSF